MFLQQQRTWIGFTAHIAHGIFNEAVCVVIMTSGIVKKIVTYRIPVMLQKLTHNQLAKRNHVHKCCKLLLSYSDVSFRYVPEDKICCRTFFDSAGRSTKHPSTCVCFSCATSASTLKSSRSHNVRSLFVSPDATVSYG
jgi:hypothetical protein